MSSMPPNALTVERTLSQPVRLQTTLYDLITAIHTAAGPAEDETVVATLMHMLQTYRVTYTRGVKTYRLVCDHASPPSAVN